MGDISVFMYDIVPVRATLKRGLNFFQPTIQVQVAPVTNPPVVLNVTPSPGTPIGLSTPIQLDAIDPEDGIIRILIVAEYPGTNIREVVYDGAGFGPMYRNGYNSATAIANGVRFVILRDGGWIQGGPVITPFVLDSTGNENA